MGDFIIDNSTFRAYFGRCFDEILLGERPYGLKTTTEIKEQQNFHTYIKKTSETDPTTKVTTSKNQRIGYYTKDKVDVKTGILSNSQKQLLKQQFLQLAYDCVANDFQKNKLSIDLSYNPIIKNRSGNIITNNISIESYYQSSIQSGNVNVELDFDSEKKKEWEKIADTKFYDDNTKNYIPQKDYKPSFETLDMYRNNGEKINTSSEEYIAFTPNYKYRELTSKNLNRVWTNIRNQTYSGNILNVDQYFDNLYKAVLEKMEPEDRKIIEEQIPNFNITKKDKDLFLSRNTKLDKHFELVNPETGGNDYISFKYPDTKYLVHSIETLKKHFSGTIEAKSEEEAKECYAKELTSFTNLILNPKSKTDFEISEIRSIFGMDNSFTINSIEDADKVKELIHDKVMPSLITSQKSSFEFYHHFNRKFEPITSVNLNKLIAEPEIPNETKLALYLEVSPNYQGLYDVYNQFVKPNIKIDGTLDMEKMQEVWINLSKQMNEPIKDSDPSSIVFVKNHKFGYLTLKTFNGEDKLENENFKSNETKLEWRNEETMNILKESINLCASDKIMKQMADSFRFDLNANKYKKLMHRQMRGREVAADALERIKSLDTKKPKTGLNIYRHTEKDAQGFIMIPRNDDELRQDYLKKCCIEMKSLKESYDNRSFWYHIAFWKKKPEKEAIAQIKESLIRNGFNSNDIETTTASLTNADNTDGAFDYKINNLQEVDTSVHKEESTEVSNLDEAAFMPFDKAKELTSQILPKYKKVVDPILGNVSEMYGVIVNGDKNEIQDDVILEEIAKNKLEIAKENPEKVYTEKDVDYIEDINSNQNQFPQSEEDKEIEKMLEDLQKVDDYDPNAPDEEEDEYDNEYNQEELNEDKKVEEKKPIISQEDLNKNLADTFNEKANVNKSQPKLKNDISLGEKDKNIEEPNIQSKSKHN